MRLELYGVTKKGILIVYRIIKIVIALQFLKKQHFTAKFLSHGNSIRAEVSYNYSWDFLICIKFCATMVTVLDPPACFARLVCI